MHMYTAHVRFSIWNKCTECPSYRIAETKKTCVAWWVDSESFIHDGVTDKCVSDVFLQPVHGTARPWSKGFFPGFYQWDLNTSGYCTKWDAKKILEKLLDIRNMECWVHIKKVDIPTGAMSTFLFDLQKKTEEVLGVEWKFRNANSDVFWNCFWFRWDLCSPPH